jgi:cardiolipin synthase A/B
MRLELLVDAPEFCAAAARDLQCARRSALVQAMTFEGDAAGHAVASMIARSPAADRRVLVDHFTRHVISDRFRWWPHNLVSPGLWNEWWQTRRMLRTLASAGAVVRFGSPVGLGFRRFPARNHKKLVALDGRVAYIGGLNFSDHNFGWHDLMLRVEDPRVAGFLEADFEADWHGRGRAGRLELEELTLHSLDGRRNEAAFDDVLDLVARAREELFLECPYVTDPFVRELERAARRGVRVVVVTSERHNFPLLREALAHAARRAPLELRLYPGRMTHVKALLADRRALVLGSANFDVWSYRSQQEYLAVIRDPGLVDEFERRVLRPDLALSRPWAPSPRARGARGLEAKLAGLLLLASLGARAPEEP